MVRKRKKSRKKIIVAVCIAAAVVIIVLAAFIILINSPKKANKNILGFATGVRKLCQGDDECALGEVCMEFPPNGVKACSQGCSDSSRCPSGLLECCPSDDSFPYGHCCNHCNGDEDCPSDFICDTEKGYCVFGCRSELDCDNPDKSICCDSPQEKGKVCHTVQCKNDDDCSKGQKCDKNTYECSFRCSCASDGDCLGGGEICDDDDKLCRKGCRNDGNCAVDEYCNEIGLVCFKGCRDNKDCNPNELCNVYHKCVPNICNNNDDCLNNVGNGYVCQGGKCENMECKGVDGSPTKVGYVYNKYQSPRYSQCQDYMNVIYCRCDDYGMIKCNSQKCPAGTVCQPYAQLAPNVPLNLSEDIPPDLGACAKVTCELYNSKNNVETENKVETKDYAVTKVNGKPFPPVYDKCNGFFTPIPAWCSPIGSGENSGSQASLAWTNLRQCGSYPHLVPSRECCIDGVCTQRISDSCETDSLNWKQEHGQQ